MADRDAYARHVGISARVLPESPERLRSLKADLIAWANSGKHPRLTQAFRSRRQRGLRDWQIVGAIQADFAARHWDPVRAAQSGRVPSLARALTRLRDLTLSEAGG